MALAMEAFVHEEEEVDHPVRYLPLGHVYSATPCINPSGSSNVMSKKVKARKLVEEGEEEMERGDGDRLDLETDLVEEGKNVKKRNTMKYELLWLGDGSGSLSGVSGPRLRGTGGFNKTNVAKTKKRVRDTPKDLSGLGKGKRWVELDFEGVADPQTFVGLACKASESLWNIAGGD